jgi:hypothetical protein
VTPDDDAPEAMQAAQSSRPACSNDQRVLKAAYYVRGSLFRALEWLVDILCGVGRSLVSLVTFARDNRKSALKGQNPTISRKAAAAEL